MEKYKNKYRIKSARHPDWDYGANGFYFITICTHDRTHFFGEIHNQKLQPSEIGKIAENCWNEIPNHFPFVVLHAHVVMPNHVHGIIQIAKNVNDSTGSPGSSGWSGSSVETQNIASLPFSIDQPSPTDQPFSIEQPSPTDQPFSIEQPSPSDQPSPTDQPFPNPLTHVSSSPPIKFGPQSNNLASIIRGYKTGVTKNARKMNPGFKWQTRYHDHIIRNEESFQRISNYIETNPLKWKEDRFYE